MSYLFFAAFLVFISGFLIQFYFTVFIHWKLRKHKNTKSEATHLPPLSVIICARNEEENLSRNLPHVLGQDYPDFEVIVVNDCSYDESRHILEEFSTQYSRLRVVTINEHERYKHGKKFAVTLGIKASVNDVLVFTDADCRPASSQWLKLMAANFTGDKEIVLGYSPYSRLDGFLNKLIRFETFFTALNYLSFALCRDPYMGVGRNLAYKKELFFRGKGFAAHMHILSGDDDLFVNQNATPDNTAIEINSSAHVISDPKVTFASYKKQKLRHYGAGAAYKVRHKRMLTLQAVALFLYYTGAVLLLAGWPASWIIILGIMMFRFAIQLITYIPVFKKLKCADLIIWLPLLELIYYIYVAVFNIATLFQKKVQWR